jgi:hypothetical protein
LTPYYDNLIDLFVPMSYPIPVKTPQALAELSTRKLKLSQRHRTVLFLIDGVRSESEVRELALQAGCPATCFDELLSQGMVVYAQETAAMPLATVATLSPDAESTLSLLPASLTLQPSVNDSVISELTSLQPLEPSASTVQDEAFEEARMILMRAVKAEAPVTGALTLLRLRRSTTRQDLLALLEDVELRITKPFKGLWATQTMSRVKELLMVR